MPKYLITRVLAAEVEAEDFDDAYDICASYSADQFDIVDVDVEEL